MLRFNYTNSPRSRYARATFIATKSVKPNAHCRDRGRWYPSIFRSRTPSPPLTPFHLLNNLLRKLRFNQDARVELDDNAFWKLVEKVRLHNRLKRRKKQWSSGDGSLSLLLPGEQKMSVIPGRLVRLPRRSNDSLPFLSAYFSRINLFKGET